MRTLIIANTFAGRSFLAPAEVESLIGDATKARTVLGWAPEYDFEALVKDMVSNDITTVAGSSAAASSVQAVPFVKSSH